MACIGVLDRQAAFKDVESRSRTGPEASRLHGGPVRAVVDEEYDVIDLTVDLAIKRLKAGADMLHLVPDRYGDGQAWPLIQGLHATAPGRRYAARCLR